MPPRHVQGVDDSIEWAGRNGVCESVRKCECVVVVGGWHGGGVSRGTVE